MSLPPSRCSPISKSRTRTNQPHLRFACDSTQWLGGGCGSGGDRSAKTSYNSAVLAWCGYHSRPASCQEKCGMTSDPKSSRVSSSFSRPALISMSTPASWYCPIRSMASATVPTKPLSGPREARRSRFAASAVVCGQAPRVGYGSFRSCRSPGPPRRNVCSSTESLYCAYTRSPSTILQASPRRATASKVICSSAPAIRTGGWGFCTGFGSRIGIRLSLQSATLLRTLRTSVKSLSEPSPP